MNWVLGTDFWMLKLRPIGSLQFLLSRIFLTLNFTPNLYQFRECHPHQSFLRKEARRLAVSLGVGFCFVWKLCFMQCLVVTNDIYGVTAKISHAHMLSVYYSCAKSCSRQLTEVQEVTPAVRHSVETLTLPLV